MLNLLDRETDRDPGTMRLSGHVHEVAPSVFGLKLMIVNAFFVGHPRDGDRGWILVDAGIPGSASRIRDAAHERYGRKSRPAAIVLTHGHFDHVGAVRELSQHWKVPVYAHPLEMPFLTGRSDYPPPDPTVGGGLMSELSRFFPRRAIDLEDRVRPLPRDGSVPGLPGWRWIHTPGHSPGHVSLFRDVDRTLIAGDAFVTTRQESLLAVLSQRPEVWRPPAYWTIDWKTAEKSVRKLAELRPAVVATGHGRVMFGAPMLRELDVLVRNFELLAVPEKGRYVGRPAITNEDGVQFIPDGEPDAVPKVLIGLGMLALGGLVFGALRKRRETRHDYYYYEPPLYAEPHSSL